MEFITENILLIALAAGSGLALLLPILNKGSSGAPAISATEAVMLMSRSKAIVLDVRDEAEYQEGHIQGAKNIPVTALAERLDELSKHKEKPVLVHCQKGMRAKTACKILAAQEFSQLRQLNGGFEAWQEAKLPIIKG